MLDCCNCCIVADDTEGKSRLLYVQILLTTFQASLVKCYSVCTCVVVVVVVVVFVFLCTTVQLMSLPCRPKRVQC